MKKILLSGMRPTGKLHLGHLTGALDNWIKLQDEYNCFFMAADWHALMSEYENPVSLSQNIFDNVVDWLSCGVDPDKCAIFIQSHVLEHLELYLIFSVITPLGLLERCPTYKEQMREVTNRDLSTYGFLGYPVLQAADILLYKAEAVPVGEDQLPHLELARLIARKFNNLYAKDGKNALPEPKALLTQVKRLLGLDARKMSKSYNNYIALSEDTASVTKKIQSMFTDPLRIKLADRGHPDKCNVHNYYGSFVPVEEKEIADACCKAKIGCSECKKRLAKAIVKMLEPIQAKRQAIVKDKDKIQGILEAGKKKASLIASTTITEVKKLIGLSY